MVPASATALALAMALGGCSEPDNSAGPGGVTMGEARALDEAAAMLDERRPPAEALQSAAPQEAPSGAAD